MAEQIIRTVSTAVNMLYQIGCGSNLSKFEPHPRRTQRMQSSTNYAMLYPENRIYSRAIE